MLPPINDERAVRLKKIAEIRAMGIDPFASTTPEKIDVDFALKKDVGAVCAVAGRIMGKRDIGKITFSHLQDESGRMQIAWKQDELGKDNYPNQQ